MTGSPPHGTGPGGGRGTGASQLDAERALFREADGQPTYEDVASYSPLPTQIGDYQIVGRLGGGSMADLYIANKVSSFGYVRRAVIKTVKRSRSDYKQLQALLLDEARATACFDHPNLIALFDVGESEHGLYLALEYVEGSDLRRVNAKLRQRKEALPFELACYVVSEVLRGVHHAHTATGPDGKPLEIIHRDVNPSNVLVAASGHVKLADFGVVRMRERIQPKTEPGLVKGKYAYLAPEYIAGEPCSVQTDIYAAGIMLFELLSGRECFSGNTAYEVMWKIVNKGVPMYRLIREGVPEDLQRIVQRATSMVPERRYHNAQDMANALEAWLMRSGRHATPWVLSVFFNRHSLFPDRTTETPPPAKMQRSLPSQVAKPTMRPEAASEHKQIQEQMKTSSQARPVDGSLTPAPDVSFEFPGDFDVPILSPDLADATTDSSIPRPSDLQSSKRPSIQDHRAASQSDRPAPTVEMPAPVLTQRPSNTPRSASRTPPPRLPPRSTSSPNLDETPVPKEEGASWSAANERTKRVTAEGLDTPAAIRREDFDAPPRADSRPDVSDLAVSPPPNTGRGASSITDDSPRKLAPGSADSGEHEPVLGAKKKRAKKRADVPATGILESGKLEDAPAATVLKRLVEERAEGIVEFRCGLIWKRVFIANGIPTGITSNMGMELIGEHLVKARKISRSALDRALAASERTGKSLTMMLLEQKSMDRETLEEELGKNLAARLQEVLEWRWGTFEYKSEPVTNTEILPKLDLDDLLRRAIEAQNAETSDPSDPADSGEYNPQKKLKEALRVARSISKSTGKGRVERPWRNSKP